MWKLKSFLYVLVLVHDLFFTVNLSGRNIYNSLLMRTETILFTFISFIYCIFCPQLNMSGTLEKGAHHQALDLSEEQLPHLHHHYTNHLHHLHHSNSVASTAAVGGERETPSRVVIPPPYSAADGGDEAPLELRGSLDCWACSVLVTAQNLVIAAINACLAGLVFGSILTPAIVMVVFGFLCHSTVRKGMLYDNSFID